MTDSIWQQFGLRANPFDTYPLVEGGIIPLEKAFVGREEEQKYLNRLFESHNNVVLAVCGKMGVGKTSLANFHKWIWKYKKIKLLFSFRREIEVNMSLLNKRSFLIEMIGSILREIRLLQPDLMKDSLLSRLEKLVGISQSLTIGGSITEPFSGFGAGISIQKETTHPLQISMSLLEQAVLDLLSFIKLHHIGGYTYSGLIVHVNNFDVVMVSQELKQKVVQFMNEMRDFLQTPDLYFLFLGPPHFFKDIVCVHQRVKGVFVQTPLVVSPLSKKELILATHERLQLLKSPDVVEIISPIADEVIYKLYDLYSGDIRSIMSAVRDIMEQSSDRLSKPLGLDESIILLGKHRWQQIESFNLTPDQLKILQHLATTDAFITQKEISHIFNIAQPNVSGYYFKPLKDAGVIEEKVKKGKMVYWGITDHFSPIKWLLASQTILKKQVQDSSDQMALF